MNFEAGNYDVIVVGAGHAGVEAALASARLGAKTLIVTISLDSVALMPCNPSIGGPAKGHVVREIDALGGEMARNIDKTNIQMRMLNTGKGPAVHALRAQADKVAYQREMKRVIEKQPNLTLRQVLVDQLIVNNGVCEGVIANTGAIYRAKAVILTTGTYLRGRIIIGELAYESGPNNLKPSVKLSENLKELGFELIRYKTGTPMRLNSRTIDYSKTEIQPGDDLPLTFSHDGIVYNQEQVPCWLTYTSARTHQIIQNNLDRAPMFSGIIEGTGPRYCPSIEDKVVRFHDKPRHQIFLEPEGRNTEEVYVQGLSTSLPEDVQHEMVRSVPGLEHAEIMRSGYAIEYDAIFPTQLWASLETKRIENLFSAGQINGTSGYEEAAAQGLMAGINAVRKLQGKNPLILSRSQAYIGVLIDDLVTKGTRDPYRLLTSRAEYRLLLRNDNADLRLMEIGHDIGLIDEERYERFMKKKDLIVMELKRMKEEVVKPTPEVQELLSSVGSTPINNAFSLETILRRPEITYDHLAIIAPAPYEVTPDVREQVEIQIKYAGYIEKQLQQVERMKKLESKRLSPDLDYDKIPGLAKEARQKLNEIHPINIGQASRIAGVNPADISVLLVYLDSLTKETMHHVK
ncbi:tRNA uridine-5-carboxymethylaminomethyl(34) synthesis enzyme MnmG [Rubeoparvulum massiliense]|uniref:tRNA uridine-5-carboxymethylaminomethyl(34) synthesis enzyme MnmG n=1 Tax=Rubeoparvulum massiliense TaxID=1631346 RepID=UPI00065E390D|nr:tRNA uridine-5-carboxymethylaminomethyl(34) synthesis enzyme MnmG [Rubeoparvulum massiliense]